MKDLKGNPENEYYKSTCGSTFNLTVCFHSVRSQTKAHQISAKRSPLLQRNLGDHVDLLLFPCDDDVGAEILGLALHLDAFMKELLLLKQGTRGGLGKVSLLPGFGIRHPSSD